MNTVSKPRKPIVAALMSCIQPGFGQLYNGEVNKALWLFGLTLLSIPALVLTALYIPNGWMAAALIVSSAFACVVWAWSVQDAWRQARQKNFYLPKSWQMSSTYVLLFVVCNIIAVPLLVNYIRTHKVESFRIPASSMEPSVLKGDVLFADKRYNCPLCKSAIARGDVAIFVNPNDRTMYYIKRIIGLPGDRVQIRGSDVAVNGSTLTVRSGFDTKGLLVTERSGEREWSALWSGQAHESPQADMTVPSGYVFVLGDNRSASRDSRFFGAVPMMDVVGKARQIWFSRGNDGVRWDRLGKTVQ